MKKSYSVIVPCFNEENGVLQTIDALFASMGDNENIELIIVNDGSTDRTGEVLEKAKLNHDRLTVLNHSRNFGYGAALKTGIRRAKHNIIVITDADGTYPNNEIPKMADLIDNADMVVGSRTKAGEVDYSALRKLPKLFLIRYCSWLAGQNIPDMNSGLRVFRKDVAEKFFNILPSGFSFTTTITVAMMTNYYRVIFHPIGYSSRVGKSKIKPIRDTLNFIQLIVRTGMYFAPLRVFFPVVMLLSVSFLSCFIYDLSKGNITDKTVILLMFTLNTGMFALLADMIDKRSSK